MLLITNGRLIVNPAMHIEELEEVIKVITENAVNDGMKNTVKNPLFKREEQPFTCFENVTGIEFFQLKRYCPDYVDLQFKAIGKESVTLPVTKMKDIKHTYTPEELDIIADEFSQKQKEKEDLEDEKKQVSKRYADQIATLETEISEHANKYRLKYEIQNKECRVIFDFKENKKYFVHPESEELLHSENLTTEDQRTLFDLEGFTPEKYQDEDQFREENQSQEPGSDDDEHSPI